MKVTLNSRFYKITNRSLSLLVILMGALVSLITAAFAGYYYWDRYIHVGDMSPMELSITHLEQAVENNPEDPETRLTLVQHYIEAENYSRAIEQAQAVLSAYPDTPGALFLLGIAYTKSQQYEAGNQALERFVEIRTQGDEPIFDQVLEAGFYYLGENYLALDQPDKAIEVLTQALHIDQSDADALYLMGQAYAKTGMHQQAIESYQRAVLFVPDFEEAYSRMSESYSALAMEPYVIYARGMAAYSTKNYSHARQDLEKAAGDLPDFSPVHVGLALVYEQLGDTQRAVDSARRVIELDPGNLIARDILARNQ